MSLRIIERGPWEETRERYRQLAVEDRPGNPHEIPHEAGEGDYAPFVIPSALVVIIAVGMAFIGGIQ